MAKTTSRFRPQLQKCVIVFVAWGLLAPSAIRPGAGRVPSPAVLGLGVFVAAGAFVVRPETVLGLVLGGCLVLAAWVVLRKWSQAPGWGAWHGYALVAGALPVYAVLGFVLTALLEPNDGVRWAGNVVFALMASVLLVVAASAVQRRRSVDDRDERPAIDWPTKADRS